MADIQFDVSLNQNNCTDKANDVIDDKVNEKAYMNEFCKILSEFIPDLLNTFPECNEQIHNGIIAALEHSIELKKMGDLNDENMTNIISENSDFIELLDHCKDVFPSRFFDILYQNEDIFNDDSINTEFLPNIDFSNLWSQNISDKTREIIWKYLQLILLALLPSVNDGNSFGDTAKLFEAIDEEEFKKKLEETVESMNNIFKFDSNETNEDNNDGIDGSSNTINLDNLPKPDELHNHINSMLGGKLGQLAQEIAEETANELDIDLENATSVNDVFKKLFKNPGKLMTMVKGIGGKLESKIKSGEISETELMKEASTMMSEMNNMPGMNNIKSMLQQFGLPTGKGKFNMNAFQSHMNQNIKHSQQRERMLKKLEERKKNNAVFSKGEAPEKSTRADKPTITVQKNVKYGKKNKKVKRKKNKNKK